MKRIILLSCTLALLAGASNGQAPRTLPSNPTPPPQAPIPPQQNQNNRNFSPPGQAGRDELPPGRPFTTNPPPGRPFQDKDVPGRPFQGDSAMTNGNTNANAARIPTNNVGGV